MITPQLINAYDTSAHSREAIKLLGTIGYESPPMSQDEHTRVRNFLLVTLAVNNATRAAGVTSLSMGKLNKAQFFPTKNTYVVQIPVHKTAVSHESLELGLTKQLYSWFSLYVTHVRPMVPGYTLGKHDMPDSPVFISWPSGNQLTSSHLASIITFELCSVGYQFRASCTKFRKMAVTLVCSIAGKRREELATFMKHNVSTQQRFYNLQQSSITSACMSDLLSKMVRGQDITEQDLVMETHRLDGSGALIVSAVLPELQREEDEAIESTPGPADQGEFSDPDNEQSPLYLSELQREEDEAIESTPGTADQGEFSDPDNEQSPLYLSGHSLTKAVRLMMQTGVIQKCIDNAKGYDVCGVSQAMEDLHHADMLKPHKYVCEDELPLATLPVLKEMGVYETLTAREKVRVLTLLHREMAQRIRDRSGSDVTSETSAASTTKVGRFQWPSTMKTAMKKTFEKEIVSQNVTLDVVKAKLRLHKALHKELAQCRGLPLYDKLLMKKVRDTIRNMYR